MATITGGIGDDLLNGTAAAEQIEGLEGSDTLNGGGGADTLRGSGADHEPGDDVLNGGNGADLMYGGDGNDTYYVNHAGDQALESDGESIHLGIDRVISTLSWTLGDLLEELRLNSGAAIDGTGNALDNTIFAGAGDNRIDGAGGIDTVSYAYSPAGVSASLATPLAQLTGGSGIDTLLDLENLAGSAYADSLGGSALANTLLGAAGEDTLAGLGGDDVLDGGPGIDLMTGGSGNDTYLLDNIGDVVFEGGAAGIDTVRSTRTITALFARVENVVLLGEGNLKAAGNALPNELTGNTGNNVLNGLGGADSLSGGVGDDSYSVNQVDDLVQEQFDEGIDLVRSTLDWTLGANLESLELLGSALQGFGNELANTITGNAAANVLAGGDENDSLTGLDGNDELDGGTGIDTLAGGAGDDIYHASSLLDVVIEASGEGSDELRTTLSTFTLAGFVENLAYTGLGNFSGTGSSGANTISGGAGNDSLNGGAGDDLLIGGTGNDTYGVDSSADIVEETSPLLGELDIVQSSASFTLPVNVENLTLTGLDPVAGTGNTLANTVVGNTAANSLSGGDGNDSLVGGLGDDTLDGGDGNDTLDGGSGIESMNGGAGNDTYVVRSDSNVVTETDTIAGAIDTVVSSVDYVLGANLENLQLGGISSFIGTGNTLANTLTGNIGANVLAGGSGNDTIAGGEGNDSLRGGTGVDSLSGGNGADAFQFDSLVLDSLVDYDRINDFVSGSDDLVFDNSLFLLDNDADLAADVTLRAAPGGWGTANEVVIFTTNVATSLLSTSSVIAAAGPANAAIAAGDRKVFVIDNGVQSSVWLFRSDALDATVSATELTLVAWLATTPSTSSADYLLMP